MVDDEDVDFEEEELKRRCQLSSMSYFVANKEKRKKMRASAMSKSLNRWM